MVAQGFSTITETDFEPKLESRQRWGKIFQYVCLAATLAGLLLLLVLVVDVVIDALPRSELQLFTNQPSYKPEDRWFPQCDHRFDYHDGGNDSSDSADRCLLGDLSRRICTQELAH
jgi:hypothetical protein